MRVVCIALAIASSLPVSLRAQNLCDPSADTLRPTLEYVRELVTATSGSEGDTGRVMYHLARMRARKVHIVTDADICGRASAVYAREARDSLQRPVLVVKAGNRYIVLSVVAPIRAGEWEVCLVLDAAFNVLERIIS